MNVTRKKSVEVSGCCNLLKPIGEKIRFISGSISSVLKRLGAINRRYEKREPSSSRGELSTPVKPPAALVGTRSAHLSSINQRFEEAVSHLGDYDQRAVAHIINSEQTRSAGLSGFSNVRSTHIMSCLLDDFLAENNYLLLTQESVAIPKEKFPDEIRDQLINNNWLINNDEETVLLNVTKKIVNSKWPSSLSNIEDSAKPILQQIFSIRFLADFLKSIKKHELSKLTHRNPNPCSVDDNLKKELLSHYSQRLYDRSVESRVVSESICWCPQKGKAHGLLLMIEPDKDIPNTKTISFYGLENNPLILCLDNDKFINEGIKILTTFIKPIFHKYDLSVEHMCETFKFQVIFNFAQDSIKKDNIPQLHERRLTLNDQGTCTMSCLYSAIADNIDPRTWEDFSTFMLMKVSKLTSPGLGFLIHESKQRLEIAKLYQLNQLLSSFGCTDSVDPTNPRDLTDKIIAGSKFQELLKGSNFSVLLKKINDNFKHFEKIPFESFQTSPSNLTQEYLFLKTSLLDYVKEYEKKCSHQSQSQLMHSSVEPIRQTVITTFLSR